MNIKHQITLGAIIGVSTIAAQAAEAEPQAELRCLALNVYHEARNQSDKGQEAVALVTINRVIDKRWPNTICGVVKDYKQFSWFWDGKSDTPYEHDKWAAALILASAVIDGQIQDFTQGANHYHAAYVKPYWIKDPHMTVTLREDAHIFYHHSNSTTNH